MFKTRVISSLIGVPLLLAVFYQGGWYWKGFFIFLAIIGLYEFYRMILSRGHRILQLPGYFLLLILLLGSDYPQYLLPGIYLLLVAALLYFVLCYPRFSPLDLAWTFLGSSYIGFLLGYALQIADLDQSFLLILLAFLLTWASDIGGYLFGSVWGTYKMIPLLSPGKSWEGAAGSLFLSVLVSFLFFKFLHLGQPGISPVILLGVVASILAQCGDLFISAIKRYSGVKDTGKIIPGHGGVLDRFDAFLLVVPAVYYFFVYWG
ncbi:MAG: phosphatidate cytidylyltransferase [Syntrophomonas sp.]|uniref:phosphatidate cytidylyltransferase n=1 Tax=Syntrophomonas sp. TaxID=2053627 RepID=UPI00260710FE|nr:phosphatidate cytidylyltransferase [Syntrophomonas sp.]MDD2510030.1 phosphatidate cytidylyltransferase [Syntrophomonas sp.]MDD3878632.1 phosphatidate cytidylyltransferase [Syntrophomonas sp.]MDD4626093.1 phosphatidate cytidylyltransferase [Syntrophomonas sp.]